MSASNFVKNFLQGRIRLTDGDGNFIDLDLDNGDLSFGPLKDVLNELVKYERRGHFKNANLGMRIYPSGSFTVMVAQFSSATAKVISDFLLRNGLFAANVSTLGAGHPVYAVNLQFTMEGTDFGDDADHVVTLEDVVCTIDSFAEGDPNTITVSFEVLGAVTGDLACSEAA